MWRALHSAPDIPPDSEAAALDHRVWFAEHPEHSFRTQRAGGGVWIIRRAGDVLLRALIPDALSARHDSDGELGPLWFAAAYPGLLAEKTQRQGRRASRQDRRGRP